ncbi:MAG: ribonuclease III domain-containing protein [Cyanobacteria bacterium P01_H01_bin.15]
MASSQQPLVLCNQLNTRALSPSQLAYLGDSVYELFVRRYYLLPHQRIQNYHQQVVSQVRAETQAIYLAHLWPKLSPAEQEVVKRGRNGAGRVPRKLNPKIYQEASGLETLLGQLYLDNPTRLAELLAQIPWPHF